MSWIELRENRERVREALREGYVDEVVACRATAFDELAGAMKAFGYWEQLECIEVELDKDEDDVPSELLMRELGVLPLLRIPNPHQAPTYLFQDHGYCVSWGSLWHRFGTVSTTKVCEVPAAKLACARIIGTRCTMR